jgi:HPr kinase/phosphorylase
MTDTAAASVHASAVMVANRAVLIRGPSGSGKSRLAFDLILAGRTGLISPAMLVGDDRVHLAVQGDHLVVRPTPPLAGLIEIRGLGIRRCAFTDEAVVGLVVDLAAEDAERLPSPEALQTFIHGVRVPRVPVKSGFQPLRLVVAALTTTDGTQTCALSTDCAKGISNHIGVSIATE